MQPWTPLQIPDEIPTHKARSPGLVPKMELRLRRRLSDHSESFEHAPLIQSGCNFDRHPRHPETLGEVSRRLAASTTLCLRPHDTATYTICPEIRQARHTAWPQALSWTPTRLAKADLIASHLDTGAVVFLVHWSLREQAGPNEVPMRPRKAPAVAGGKGCSGEPGYVVAQTLPAARMRQWLPRFTAQGPSKHLVAWVACMKRLRTDERPRRHQR